MAVSEKEILKHQLERSKEEMDLQRDQARSDPNAIYADNLREEKIANILDQINPDNLLTDIEHRIRGEKKEPYTGEWVPIGLKRKDINEDLIVNFISFLGSIMNQNVSMSNFSETEINNIMEMIITYIKQDLTVNAEKYDIKGDYVEMSRIGNIICISCFSTFKQALTGNLSKRIFGSLRMDTTLLNEQNKFNSIKFWK